MQTLSLLVNLMNKTLVIAEVGVNHNGSLNTAFKLVEEAQKAGADIVKFQAFKAELLVTESAKMATYQEKNTGHKSSQLEMLKKLELSEPEFIQLFDFCRKKNIGFMATAFDENHLSFLNDRLKVDHLKIASGELTNLPFVLAHAKTGKNILLSTGMSNLTEIEQALGTIAFGYTSKTNESPSLEKFQHAFQSDAGKRLLNQKVTLLHCVSEYPVPENQVNLKAIQSLGQRFGIPIGYSDHSEGVTAAIAAVSLGARIIEKHFTLDKSSPGPDHLASIEPEELTTMVAAIRFVENAMGTGEKVPQPCEKETTQVARKSLVASKNIVAGEPFTPDNLTVKRPGDGLSPSRYWEFLEKSAVRNYMKDELIEECPPP